MRIARFVNNRASAVGIVEGSEIVEVDVEIDSLLVDAAAGNLVVPSTSGLPRFPLDDVTLLPPLEPGVGRIFCVGINYLEHQRESADTFVADVPTKPIVFLKDESSIASPFDVLTLPRAVSTQFDWEVELGVVIGAPGYAVPRSSAWDIVAGYTVVNDITARDLQRDHVQWCLGKNVERATPVGPWIVTRDDLGVDPDLELRLVVNDAVKQVGRTSDLIFDVPTLIETISRVTTLRVGDLIATGTPEGVGFKRTPPEFLRNGDVVETTIEGVGTLSNRVAAS